MKKADFDFDRFDMIIGMDDQNIKDLYAIARSPEDHKKIFLLSIVLFCRNDYFA